MNQAPLLKVENLSKVFHVYPSKWLSLCSLAGLPLKNKSQQINALKNISFAVKKGQFFGIIGLNGAGKSTLLKILSRTLYATSGEFYLQGKVLSLLELGVGFNQELSGRENILLSGELLGFSQEILEAKMPEIEAFAEIGDAIHRPVKFYSNGMYIRIAFAMFTVLSPDIMIIDEALSVGDIQFQQKCFARMQEQKALGKTVIFATHDMPAVQNFCDEVLYLKNGEMVYLGNSAIAVNRFYEDLALEKRGGATKPPAYQNQLSATYGEGFLEKKKYVERQNILREGEKGLGEGLIQIKAACLIGESGVWSQLRTNDKVKILLLLNALKDSESYSVNFGLVDRQNILLFGTSSFHQQIGLPKLLKGEEILIEMEWEVKVEPGEYTFTLSVSEHDVPNEFNLAVNQDSHSGLGPIVVSPADINKPNAFFRVYMPLTFTSLTKQG